MLRISYFWPDWNFYARLGVFHTIFSTKEVTFLFFSQNLTQILHCQILNICRVLYTKQCVCSLGPYCKRAILYTAYIPGATAKHVMGFNFKKKSA